MRNLQVSPGSCRDHRRFTLSSQHTGVTKVLNSDFRSARVDTLREEYMKYTIDPAPAVLCSTLLLLGCVREDTILAPKAHAFSSPATLTSAAVTDPEGDARASNGNGLRGEAYQDIVNATVSKTGGSFVFSMGVRAPLPASPVLHPGTVLQEWSWNINTAPTFPKGFPFAPGIAAPLEFSVLVLWDGTNFTASVIDRRPLLVGGEATIVSVPFAITGAQLDVSVDGPLLGNPASFLWIARTNDWPTHLGTNSVQTLDRSPDAFPAGWPE
jgi:hypothetical protein